MLYIFNGECCQERFAEVIADNGALLTDVEEDEPIQLQVFLPSIPSV